MPTRRINIPHRLTQDEAATRIKDLMTRTKLRFADDVSEARDDWDGNRCAFGFSVMGLQVSGTLQVRPSEVEIETNLPLAAMLVWGNIEATIRRQAEELLA